MIFSVMNPLLEHQAFLTRRQFFGRAAGARAALPARFHLPISTCRQGCLRSGL